MKIALCSKGKFSLEIGSTKNRIELADALKQCGWETKLIDNACLGLPADEYQPEKFTLALKDYLIKYSDLYDVVLYEYDSLPYDRTLFSENTVFIARPAILAYHLPLIKFKLDLKSKVYNWYRNTKALLKKDTSKEDYLKKINFCLKQSDIIQVQNTKDKNLLISKGFNKEKIIIIPNGISRQKINAFGKIKRDWNTPIKLVCVGTFDYRKGAIDFPLIFKEIKSKFPDCQLKLLGTSGLFKTSEEVLKFFPKKYHRSIEVITRFKSEELPGLLSDCHLGLFPSYLESFGFGALEMMSAGIPVVAYNSPGPCDFVPGDLLITTGDFGEMSKKLIFLISNITLLKEKSSLVRKIVAEDYNWEKIALMCDEYYKKAVVSQRRLKVLY